MQTVTSNTPQQINSALFALDKSIKELNTAINVIEKALKENDATLLEKINEKVNKADVVDAVTDGDLNPITSNAVYDGLSEKVNTSDVVDRIEVSNTNPVTSNAVTNALSYSATEHIIGYWTDGITPVYEKTFVSSFTNTSVQYSTNFSDLPNNINRVLGIFGMINGENSFCMNIPFNDVNYTPNWNTYVNYDFSVNRIYFACGLIDAIPAGTRVSIILTIRYTKAS